MDKIFNRKADPNILDLKDCVKPSPAVCYVDILFYEMITHDNLVKELNSNNMPTLAMLDYKVDYKHATNRIKIMAGLNPYPNKEETKGKFRVKVHGIPYTGYVTVAPNDESLKINIEKGE